MCMLLQGLWRAGVGSNPGHPTPLLPGPQEQLPALPAGHRLQLAHQVPQVGAGGASSGLHSTVVITVLLSFKCAHACMPDTTVWCRGFTRKRA